jgi:hypothetical protein
MIDKARPARATVGLALTIAALRVKSAAPLPQGQMIRGERSEEILCVEARAD